MLHQSLITSYGYLRAAALTALLATVPGYSLKAAGDGAKPIPMPESRARTFRELGIEAEELMRSTPRPASTTETQATMAKRHYFMASHYAQTGRLKLALEELDKADKFSPGNFHIVLAQAEYQLETGNIPAALANVNRILSENPNHVQALLVKAQALLIQAESGPRAKRAEQTQGALAVLQAARKAQPKNESVLRNLVRMYARLSDLKGLESAYRELVEAAPRDPGSKLMLARLLGETNRPEESLTYYDKVISQRRSFIPARMEKARLQELLGRLDQAAETYREAILVDPRNRQVRDAFDRVLRLIHQGENSRQLVLAAYADFSAKYPYSSEIRRIYAEQLLNAGDKDGAIREFRKIVDADDDNPEAHLNLGRLLIGLNRTEEALAELRRAHDLRPDSPEILTLLGNTLMSAGRASEATDIFRKALRDMPEDPDLQLGLATVLFEGRDSSGSLEMVRQVLPKLGTNAEKLGKAGQLFLRAGKAEEAVPVLAKATAAKPTDPEVLGLAIRAYVRSNKVDDAVAIVDRARAARIAMAPEDLFTLLAEELQAGGFVDAAESWYSRAVDSAPQRIGILARLVTHLTVNKRHDRALEILRKVSESTDESDEVLRLEASVWQDRGDHEKATQLYRSLRDRRPGSVEPVALLAEALAMGGKAEPAIAELTAAEKKFGKNEDFEFARAIVYMRLRRFDQAVKSFRAVSEKGVRRNTDATFFLATTYVDLKKYREAEETYRRGLESNPDDPRLLNGLGYFLADQNTSLTEARGLIEKALEVSPRAGHIIDSMAWLLYREGRYDEALMWIEEAVAFSGHEAEILEHKGMILEALKRPQDAVEAYRLALAAEPTRATSRSRLKELTDGASSTTSRRSRRN